MDRKNPIESIVYAPNNAAKANDDQSTIYHGAEGDFTQLGRDVTLQNIPHRVEGWIIGITNEICRATLAHILKTKRGMKKRVNLQRTPLLMIFLHIETKRAKWNM